MAALPFNAGAERAWALARREAQCHGIPAVFTAHLLMGLISAQDAAIEHVLGELGLTADAVLTALGQTPVSEDALPRGPEPHLTDRCTHALAEAQEEAHCLGSEDVGPEHLLLGLILVETAWAGQALAELGVRPDSVRAAVRSLQGVRLLRAAEAVPVDLALVRPAASQADERGDDLMRAAVTGPV
jgi:ATP-dependent Clp protease ATP-binding subunit ClpA